MNKDEIKKALVLCQMSAVSTCKDCPYTENCDGTQLYKDALNLITEQEEHIKIQNQQLSNWENNYTKSFERLKAQEREIERLKAEKKQAKIDVLNELKKKIVEHMGNREYMGVKYKQGVFSESEIDELIKEVQNAEDKG